MERGQFTFYRSFWEAMKALPKRDQLPFVAAVCAYIFEGEDRPLSGAAAASFLLVKPILDKASKKAESGKQGGSKPKANRKQTGREGEREIEIEGEIEVEGEIEIEIEGEMETEIETEGEAPPTPQDTAAAAVLAAYRDQVHPQLSRRSQEQLAGFVSVMGPEVCLRAIDHALDAKKANFPYIRAILQAKQDQGVRCLADWDAWEERRRRPERPPSGNVFLDMLREEEAHG